MTLERPNLSDAFTAKRPPVDRTASLAGLLPPTRPRIAPTPAPTALEPAPTRSDTEPAAEDTPLKAPDTPTAPRAAQPLRAPKTTRVSDTADITANVAVYLEPDVLEHARIKRRTTGITYDELVVRAFAAVPDEEIQQALQPAPQHQDATVMPTRQRRLRGTAGIQIQVRLTGTQRSWLDTKQQTVGAPSRSALVATALRLYLTR